MALTCSPRESPDAIQRGFGAFRRIVLVIQNHQFCRSVQLRLCKIRMNGRIILPSNTSQFRRSVQLRFCRNGWMEESWLSSRNYQFRIIAILQKCMNGRINKDWIAVNLQYLKCWLLSTNPPLEVLGCLTVKSTGPYHKTGGTAGTK